MADWKRQWPVVPTFSYGGINYGELDVSGAARRSYPRRMDRRAWTLLLVLGAIWGASYMLIKIGVRDLSPGMVAFGRVALGAAVLVAFAWRRGALGGLRAGSPAASR